MLLKAIVLWITFDVVDPSSIVEFDLVIVTTVVDGLREPHKVF